MKHGFLKVAAMTPKIKVADCEYNGEIICEELEKAYQKDAKIIVFPELCITGATCGDLFEQDLLLMQAREELLKIASYTEGHDALVFLGLPVERENSLYNVAAVVQDGNILGMIPQKNVPMYGENSQGRYFTEGNERPVIFEWNGEEIPFGTNLLFDTDVIEGMRVGCEIGEDAWVGDSPAIHHAYAGATVIVNLSASPEAVGRTEYREELIKFASIKTLSAYLYCNAGEGESTQDVVFGGQKLIVEDGRILARAVPYEKDALYADLDLSRIRSERRKRNTFKTDDCTEYIVIPFELKKEETKLIREFSSTPFVPKDERKRQERCQEIIRIQAYGLKKRYEHIGCKTAVIGISGGLDSTLALLVTVRTFDLLGLDRKNIYAVTMPCFGTTDRTYMNACTLSRILGTTLKEIDIKEAVKIHFCDIDHEQTVHDVTYENSQARERTQVLMDFANSVGGLVIGTGDLSELVLGWATYNGDHMSMYGVNVGVPKTLVRHLVQYFALETENMELKKVLEDILATPVSPELLPPDHGDISQRTEDLVGPYELHDFFLYYLLRYGYEPEKIYRIAKKTFEGNYGETEILKWLKIFYKRFFAQQFKRSCLPDGPKVGSISISPRGDWKMPSDASVKIWVDQLEDVEKNI